VNIAAPAVARTEAGGMLERAASASFLLFVAALPWSIAAMTIAAALCGVLTLALWLARRVAWRSLTPIFWETLGWLAALSLATLFAVDPSASATRLGKGFLPLLVALAATHSATARAGGRALGVLLGSATLAALAGWVGFALRGASFTERASGPVGHYMTFGGQLLLVLCVAAGLAAAARDRRWRLAALACGGLCLLALSATFTRSAWLGLIAALALILTLTRPRWLVALAVVVALIALLAPTQYRARFASAFDPEHPFNRERLLMWQAGAHMFRDHPITGVGLQDLSTLYDRYRLPAARERVGHLDNDVVQIAASMGVVGLVAFVALMAGLFRAAAAGIARARATPGIVYGVKLGVLAALTGFLVAGLFEFNVGDEELMYMLFTLVGIAWAAREWGPQCG
jgi:O-antigen ligase